MDGFTKLQAQTGQATAATISYLECRRGHLWLGCVRLALIFPLPPAMYPSFHCRAAPPIFSMGSAATLFLKCMISYLIFFSTLPIKLKLGLQKMGILLIANHLDQSNHLANQQQVLGFAVPFASLRILCKSAGPKPFC